MNIKNAIRVFLIALGIYLFVYIPIDAFFLNPPQTEFKYQVVGKVQQQFTESTGKYSSQTSMASFIRIRYENGSEKTLTVTDPYIAESYVIGNSYLENRTWSQEISFGQGFCCFIFIIICFVAFIVFVSGIFAWLFSDKSLKQMIEEE